MTGAAPKILIVEDEGIVARDLQQSLIEMGYDAYAIAASAEEAMASASAVPPDVVLMDIRIKGKYDGIQAAAALKQKNVVNVIYLTAHADDDMVDRAKRTEPQGYLLKPVKMPELRSMIEVVLYKSEAERQLRAMHEKVRHLAQRLETVREEERRAVAAVLHDGLAQELFAIKLDLGRLQRLVKRRVDMQEICQETMLTITKCMESTRQVANDLRPVALAYLPVSTVIIEHARHFGPRSGLAIRIIEGPGLPKLSEAKQLLLFRAAQEGLTNVARHAQATEVDINLQAIDGRITLEIVDDGIGFADGASVKPRSLGIFALRERFEALGGGLVVRRAETRGTELRAFLPSAELQ
jgi:signal transduction histidine kinase